jgi:hypothetical protein
LRNTVIFWIIAELLGNAEFPSAARVRERLTIEHTFQSQLRNAQSGHESHKEQEELCFPGIHSKGLAAASKGLPSQNHSNPIRRSLTLEVACDVVTCGWIRRRLLRFSRNCFPAIILDRTDNKRFTSSVSDAILSQPISLPSLMPFQLLVGQNIRVRVCD